MNINIDIRYTCIHVYIYIYVYTRLLGCSVMSDSLLPHGQQPSKLSCPWNFPGKNTGVDCHFLLQGIFPIQESNPCIGRQILYHSTTWEASINEICTYICISVSPANVDIDHNTNSSILGSGLEGLLILFPYSMAEENFAQLNKVSWVRLKWIAMQSQVLMFSEQFLLEREKSRDIENYTLSTIYAV